MRRQGVRAAKRGGVPPQPDKHTIKDKATEITKNRFNFFIKSIPPLLI